MTSAFLFAMILFESNHGVCVGGGCHYRLWPSKRMWAKTIRVWSAVVVVAEKKHKFEWENDLIWILINFQSDLDKCISSTCWKVWSFILHLVLLIWWKLILIRIWLSDKNQCILSLSERHIEILSRSELSWHTLIWKIQKIASIVVWKGTQKASTRVAGQTIYSHWKWIHLPSGRQTNSILHSFFRLYILLNIFYNLHSPVPHPSFHLLFFN